jgi:hypothetical protein
MLNAAEDLHLQSYAEYLSLADRPSWRAAFFFQMNRLGRGGSCYIFVFCQNFPVGTPLTPRVDVLRSTVGLANAVSLSVHIV